MRRALRLAAGLALAALPASAQTLHFGGVDRTYLMHAPPGAQGPRPLFLVLHPGGSSAAQFRRMTRFDAAADAAGAVAVYPQGFGAHWNDGRRGAEGAALRASDDVGFLLALIDDLAARGIADAGAVHVVGHSNGGMMAMRLACAAPERLRSLAAVSASLPVGLDCPAGRPVAALFIRGSADPYLPPAGGHVKNEERRGSVRSAEETLRVFAERNGCSGLESQPLPAASANGEPGALKRYRRCRGAPTAAISVRGSGHGWPGVPYGPRMTAMIGPAAPSFSATNTIARFFVERALP
jgi:polyhydroxybutyrate depolymerase